MSENWNEMSLADQRRWALETVRFAEQLALRGVSIDLFKEADALLAYVNGEAITPLASEALPAPQAAEDTPSPPLFEAA